MRNNTETLTCPRCHQPVEDGQPICPECGTIINPRRHAPKMLTAWPWVDYTLGFATAVLSALAFCVPVMGSLLLYFSIRERYPTYARGIWAGLITTGTVFLIAFFIWMGIAVRPHGATPVAH